MVRNTQGSLAVSIPNRDYLELQFDWLRQERSHCLLDVSIPNRDYLELQFSDVVIFGD